jgi:hypothetical protein
MSKAPRIATSRLRRCPPSLRASRAASSNSGSCQRQSPFALGVALHGSPLAVRPPQRWLVGIGTLPLPTKPYLW